MPALTTEVLRERLTELGQAATTVFLRRGYKRTRIRDISDEVGWSEGNVYRYVESKDALFDFVLRLNSQVEMKWEDLQIPLPTPEPDSTLAFLRSLAESQGQLPTLQAALNQDGIPPDNEFFRVLEEIFRTLSSNRQVITLVEQSALDREDLYQLIYQELRMPTVYRLSDYLSQRSKDGYVRDVESPDIAARLILETLATFAIHRHFDPYPQQMEEEQVRTTVVRSLAHAFLVDAEGTDRLPPQHP